MKTNYNLLSKFFIGCFIIVMIFVLFAVFSKPAVNKNNQEKLEYAQEVFLIFKSQNPEYCTYSLFMNESSQYHKKINYTSKKVYRSGIFVYKLDDEKTITVFWHKTDEKQIEIEKATVEITNSNWFPLHATSSVFGAVEATKNNSYK